jgi:hypothetical protein
MTNKPVRRNPALIPGMLPTLAASLLLASVGAPAFDSGSTGEDGPFAPSVSTRLPLPEDGVFNFTTVDIPEGVTLSFERNTANTPVVVLASGDVSIAGAISVAGADATDSGASGDGNVGDDGLPGLGGPGGYDGGSGGLPEGDFLGGDGLGPGGGGRGIQINSYRTPGGGGSFGTKGRSSRDSYSGESGAIYGSDLLLPLIGGSGGGGGMGGGTFSGSGGGGGGGALLIASSGTIRITGSVIADGGRAGDSGGGNCGAVGGGGSGGAIRLAATRIEGEGVISAAGGSNRQSTECTTSGYSVIKDYRYHHRGGNGRIRLEAETLGRTAATTPAYSFGQPGELYVAGLPSLRIASVAGVAAPANPTGIADIQLPSDVPNPADILIEASGIPLGNVVELRVTPSRGEPRSTVSNALDGSVDLSTATALIDLPQGPSTLMATVTYTLVAAASGGLEQFAGEPVDALRVEATLTGEPRYLLITKTRREIPISPAQLAAAG